MKTTAEKIEVMQAFLEGKEIEVRALNIEKIWHPVIIEPLWDWSRCEYRIKPKEPRKFWLLKSENKDKNISYQVFLNDKGIEDKRIQLESAPFFSCVEIIEMVEIVKSE